ncbi:MAG: hypothetical protein QOE58_2918, partial [Actinomycetota bacterium]|nr:hypothetical protein [Actinomycetota bacterium]
MITADTHCIMKVGVQRRWGRPVERVSLSAERLVLLDRSVTARSSDAPLTAEERDQPRGTVATMSEGTRVNETRPFAARPGTRAAVAVLLAVVTAAGQAVPASGVSPPSPASRPDSAQASKAQASKAQTSKVQRIQSMAAEQSGAASAGRVLGLSSAEKLVVKDVITDPDGSTHVRYDRTLDGLRVIGGDFVSHRDSSGKLRDVSWNGAREVAVVSTKPTLSLASAEAAGDRKASLAQETTAATKAELVVYAGGAPGKVTKATKGANATKVTARLAYDVLTVGVGADQTPSRLHTIVDA